MTSAMDEAVGNVVKAFKGKGIWKDTLLVFTTGLFTSFAHIRKAINLDS